MGLLGMICFIGFAVLISENRRHIPWKTVAAGLALQVIFALLILGVPSLGIPGLLRPVFVWANAAVLHLIAFSDKGTDFLFGPLANTEKVGGFIVAIKVLPTIIFFSTVMAVLYHIGIMQLLVRAMARVMRRTMGVSAAESLAAAGNVFVGQTEAPLVVKPFVEKMTRSELMSLMTGGMATVAGGVMAAYVQLLSSRIPDIAGHLITASVMSAPAALLFAKIIIPEEQQPETAHSGNITMDRTHANLIDAAASGASDGLKLAVNVGAMLFAFISLIALVNGALGGLGDLAGWTDMHGKSLTFQYILGWLFLPFAFLLGIPWDETFAVAQLLGEKIILNEFVAYTSLANQASALSDKAVIVASYALCGFANIASIAIQIGGIGSIAPNQRVEISRLGIRSVIAGSLAAFMTACIAGLLIA